MYPIPCTIVETKYNDTGELFLKFQYRNGKSGTFTYIDIIILKQDYNQNDIFGESPVEAIAPM
ncbi:phage portal protein, partial [[Eubacterium] rectale]|nr:phage portal protein [Agathobacter rectalis]